MTPNQQLTTLKAAVCDVAFDNLTRQLYATDASVYQIEPLAVAFPGSAHEASSIIQAAAQAGVSVIPRGAGTSLSGGAIGDGLVVDFARYNRLIYDLNLERKTVRVGAGVILDQLNDFLASAQILFRPGRGDQFARDAGRHDCQRFVRRARAGLWHHGGSHQRAGNFNQRRARREGRFRPGRAARNNATCWKA